MQTTRRSRRSVAVGGLALAVVGGAVWAGVLASGAGSSPRSAVAASAPQAAPAIPTADLALEAWPGLRGDLVRDETVYADEYRAREQLIRSCMRDRGFTYVPIPLQYGPATSATFRPDPNARIVSALSAERQRSYYLAYSNTTGPEDTGTGFDLDTPGQAGCLGAAHQALPGIFRVPGELQDAVTVTRASASDDQAVVAAADGWRSCLAGRFGADVPEGLTSPGDIDRVVDEGLVPPDVVASLRTASEDCRGGLDRAFDTALRRAEAAFVRTHHEALESHRESLIADHRAFGLSVAELQ